MNKQEIINNISATHGVTKIVAKVIFEQIFEDIVETIQSPKNDNKIQIPGFGTFKMETRKARDGRNPKTDEVIRIPAKRVVKFKASKTLLENIN